MFGKRDIQFHLDAAHKKCEDYSRQIHRYRSKFASNYLTQIFNDTKETNRNSKSKSNHSKSRESLSNNDEEKKELQNSNNIDYNDTYKKDEKIHDLSKYRDYNIHKQSIESIVFNKNDNFMLTVSRDASFTIWYVVI